MKIFIDVRLNGFKCPLLVLGDLVIWNLKMEDLIQPPLTITNLISEEEMLQLDEKWMWAYSS